MDATIDEGRLKTLLKSALVEVLEERSELLSEIVEEALLDIGLVRAIEEGASTPEVSRDQVMALLER